MKALEGKPLGTTLIAILQFPDEDAVKAFATDPAYAPYGKMRQEGSDSRLQLIDDTDAAGTIPNLRKGWGQRLFAGPRVCRVDWADADRIRFPGISIQEGHPMINARALAAIVAAAVILQSQVAQAEEYRIVGADAATACQSGERSETMTLDGPRDASVARADGDKLNVAVCVDPGSKSAVNVRYRANSYWYSSGNVSEGCVEILGASKVKVRAVDTNFHQSATYYSCVQER